MPRRSERDGLVTSLRYGDHGPTGGRRATEAQTLYDDRRRPELMSVFRQADLGAIAPELSAVLVPFSQELTWDAASNLVAIDDLRMENEWPSGYLPQSVEIRHDSLYRVIRARYQYTQPDGSLDDEDAATDWRTSMAATYAHDPMRTEPAPSVSTMGGSRVRELNWSWDYLANTTSWTDDASRFYERSIGAIVNGDDLGEAERPSAIRLSTSLPRDAEGQLGADAGWLEVDYGSGGNVHVMTVHGQCADVEPQSCVDSGHPHFDTRRNLLRQNCACASEQHYEYRWDELNRLIEARRYDRVSGGEWELEVRQRYRYDAANQRVVKQTLDQDAATCGDGAGLTPCERIALYVYPGDFERRGLRRGFDGYEADETLRTETQYVVAGARTVWRHGDADFAFDEEHRLTMVLADLIETNAAVMDLRTGELLEASTYYPNGARETYRVNEEATTTPEADGFTRKEGDEEVGLVYFGERYLITRLGRWATPDPLQVHAVGGGVPLNSFHYVSGSMLASRDPLGLQDWGPLPDDASANAMAGHEEGITPENNVQQGVAAGEGVVAGAMLWLGGAPGWIGRAVLLADGVAIAYGAGQGGDSYRPQLHDGDRDLEAIMPFAGGAFRATAGLWRLGRASWRGWLRSLPRVIDRARTRLRFFGSGATNASNQRLASWNLSKVAPDSNRVIGRHGNVSRALTEGTGPSGLESHHIGQDAAFGGAYGGVQTSNGVVRIEREVGLATPLPGNPNQPGTLHAAFHLRVNQLWQRWIRGPRSAPRPTVREYNAAARQGLIDAQFTEAEADAAMDAVRAQQAEHGITPDDRFVYVPGER